MPPSTTCGPFAPYPSATPSRNPRSTRPIGLPNKWRLALGPQPGLFVASDLVDLLYAGGLSLRALRKQGQRRDQRYWNQPRSVRLVIVPGEFNRSEKNMRRVCASASTSGRLLELRDWLTCCVGLDVMPLAPWLRALSAVGDGCRGHSIVPHRARGRRGRPTRRLLPTPLISSVVWPTSSWRRSGKRSTVTGPGSSSNRGEREAARAQAGRADRQRQAGIQGVGQVRLLAVMCVTVWVASAAAAGFLGPVPTSAKWLLGLVGPLSAWRWRPLLSPHRHLATWLAGEPNDLETSSPLPDIAAYTALPWLVLAGFVLTAASILVGV